MPRPAPRQSPDALYRARLVTWVAMLFSIAMYFVVVQIVHPDAATDNPMLVQVLLLAAVALVAASFGVKSYFSKRALDTKSPAFVRAGELIAFTLCEAAALFGLVVWFVAASPRYYWFLILGAAGQLLHYPRRED
jgi:hypothetical protein